MERRPPQHTWFSRSCPEQYISSNHERQSSTYPGHESVDLSETLPQSQQTEICDRGDFGVFETAQPTVLIRRIATSLSCRFKTKIALPFPTTFFSWGHAQGQRPRNFSALTSAHRLVWVLV